MTDSNEPPERSEAARELSERLKSALDEIKHSRLNYAAGMMISALASAAVQGVVLDAHHADELCEIETRSRSIWPQSVFGFEDEPEDIRVHRI